ncbi:MAG: hypothetical protein HPKKFMNG_02650 [Planctomycetes bacterium]|nr:hypothetical protein [Planctomycetota bacterium]
MKFTALALLLVTGLAAQLQAQGGPQLPANSNQASPSKESFLLEPPGLATGAKDAYLRLVSNSPAGFASSSSKQPEIRLGEGVKLVTGSFRLLSPNEAECRVDVDADAMGTVEVSLVFYSVNGTSVLSTQRATLGLLGPTKISGIDISVESVALVRVNVSEAQAAGVVVLSGPVNGALTLVAPTGCRFSRAPLATTTKGTINTPGLAEGNTQFTFGVGNAAGEAAVVRITEILYDTSTFTLTGGALGALNCELRGGALSGQSTLVANAYTALITIAGTNDNTDTQPAPGGQNSNSTSTPEGAPVTTTVPGDSTSGGTGRSRDSERAPRQGNQRDTSSPARSSPPTSGPTPQGGGSSTPPPRAPEVRSDVPPPPPRSEAPAPPRAVPAGSGASSAGGDGGARWVNDPKPAAPAEAPDAAPKMVLITTPGLYFCDKDFGPVDMVVLNSLVSDRAAARVWIVVKLEKDKNPDAIETIDVTLRVSGTVRQLKLTETGKNTGEFRCDKAGVLLVSDENPESNPAEKPVSEPKARPSGLAR